jgi:hypothetical protein
VGFVTGKVALGQVFSEYVGFPCQFSFHRLLHTHHLSSGPGTIGQILADVPSGLSLTPTHENYLILLGRLSRVTVECVALLVRIKKVQDSNHNPYNSYPRYPHFLQANTRKPSQIWPRPLPPTSSPTYYSNIYQPELRTVSLNKQ